MAWPLRVLVVGGGSAGWIAAATLDRRLNGDGPRRVAITVVESPETPRIGVGEATIPTIRDMLRRLGISEAAFMRSCEASFKHGIRFDDWSGPRTRYLHPFQRAAGLGGEAARWLASDGSAPFADLVSVQGALIAAGRGPRLADAPDYAGDVPYAYHMDAEMFAESLAANCQARGVQRLRAHVTAVDRDERGLVEAVRLRDGAVLSADLYLDCTGFRALLSPQAGEPGGWIDHSDHLLCDRAVVFRVPHDPERVVPASFTRARALSTGWCWDIGLLSRRGRGYVYSSAHISPEAAEAELRLDESPAGAEAEARHLAFRVGRLAEPWRGNVVAVGLAAGFLEPLESTGLWLADFAARSLAEMFPPTAQDAAAPALARRHNRLVAEAHDEILDFITVHYIAAGRRDTTFWRAASDPARCSERLRDLLELWRIRPPSFADFSLRYPPFNHVNYEFVLFGSGWRPSGAALGTAPAAPRRRLTAETARLMSTLPEHGRLLRAIHGEPIRGAATAVPAG